MPVITPYMARWSGEVGRDRGLVVRNGRLAYRDENRSDRDGKGVLWARCTDTRGRGQVLFGQVHPRRQRAAVWQMLCQVCGGEPDEDDSGVLWLLPTAVARYSLDQPVITTSYPPVCAACVRVSVRTCPALRDSYGLLRVRDAQLAGVIAEPYLLTPRGQLVRSGLRPDGRHAPTFRYGDPGLAMALASHQLITLLGFSPVDPAAAHDL